MYNEMKSPKNDSNVQNVPKTTLVQSIYNVIAEEWHIFLILISISITIISM